MHIIEFKFGSESTCKYNKEPMPDHELFKALRCYFSKVDIFAFIASGNGYCCLR